MRRTLILAAVAVTFLSSCTLIFQLQPNAMASDARNFNAGRIIDDGIFTNSDAMSPAAIQNFLNSKVSNCDTWGSKTSELGGGTRAQWLAAHGYSTPVTCLKDYYENPANTQSNYGSQTIPAGAISAAQIIYNYSKQFNINPQVLIVTLQKENGMVTDEWPTPKQYREAMGFGCPDNTAPGAPACDPNYGSFSAQIYQAARHFRGYIDKPSGWFVPFTTGVNSIAWSPTASCGRSDVNIENRSTVALYSYTPYRPNQAALNAQYGTGDSCSAYGNRNFYLYFTDWFGSTTMNSTFLRTVDNATLYFISGNNKYPIADISMFNALYPLGGVGYVSQSFLDTKTTGQTLGRVIRSSDGTVYFYDAGIKLPFGSCAQVEAYGSTCGQSVPMEDYQINSLVTGPGMTNVMATTSGKRFYMDGTKREVYDTQTLNDQGINTSANVLNESSLNGLAYGSPLIRDDVFIRDRTNGTLYGYTGNTRYLVDAGIAQGTFFSGVNASKLDSASIGKLSIGIGINGYVKSNDESAYIFTDSGKIKLNNPAEFSNSYAAIPDSLLARIPTTQTLSAPYVFKSKSSGTVYLAEGGKKRSISSWTDLVDIANNQPILSLENYYLDSIPDGTPVLSTGILVRSSSDATIYLVDGLRNKIAMDSFYPSSELGFKDVYVIADSILNAYPTDPTGNLIGRVKCGSNEGIAINGSIYSLDIPSARYSDLSAIACNKLTWKSTPSFLLGPDGTIYQIKNAQKNSIASYQTYSALGGNTSNTIRSSAYSLNLIPDGPTI